MTVPPLEETVRLPHLDLLAHDEVAERGMALVGTAVGAVAGSVASSRERLRQLPTTAVQLPVLAFNSALVTAERLRGEAQHAGGAAALARTKVEQLPQQVTGLLSLARFVADSAMAGISELRGGHASESATSPASAPSPAPTSSTAPASSARTAPPSTPAPSARASAPSAPAPAPAPRAPVVPAPVADRAAEAAPVMPATRSPRAKPAAKKTAAKQPPVKPAAQAPMEKPTQAPVEKPSQAPAEKPATRQAPVEKPAATPAPEPLAALQTDRDTMASPATAAVVADVTELTGPADPPQAADLPLENYDGLTLAAIRARMRSLSVDDLVTLRAYEKAHADRVQIVTMLDNRIAKVSQG